MSKTKLKLSWRPYRRRFRAPFRLKRGTWLFREGGIVRLEDRDGRVGFGEVAPLPWFGTETWEQAQSWLQERKGWLDAEAVHPGNPASPPAPFICLRGALAFARCFLEDDWPLLKTQNLTVAGLLPTGWKVLQAAEDLCARGYRTLKWKIGAEPVQDVQLYRMLLARLPDGVKLRLDANGGLVELQAKRWLETAQDGPVEFIEQPLPPDELDAMRRLTCETLTAIALDESVADFASLRRVAEEGWTDPVVVKPAILGNPDAFMAWRDSCKLRLVYSSAFETSIGLEAALRVAASDPRRKGALGFGTLEHFEDDGLIVHRAGPRLQAGRVGVEQMLTIWEMLAKTR